MIDGVLYDMAAPAVTHQEIVFEIEDVKNQKVIVYDLGDDAILLIEVLRKKRYKNQKWRKAYEINNIRNRKCNGK